MTQSFDAKKRLLFIIALASISRILFAIITAAINGPLPFYREDSNSYILPARSLLQESFMSSGVNSVLGTPELYRTPGYPLVLLPAVAIHHVVIVALAENFLLVAFSAMLVWKIANRFLPGSQAGCWAAVFYCFEPLGFVLSETIMSETVFIAALLLGVWWLLEFLCNPRYPKLVISAVALAGTAYIRPVSLYLGFWLVPLFLFFPKKETVSRRIFHAALFPVVFALTLAPWVVRNALVADYPKFSSSPDYNLYFMAAGPVEARVHPRVLSQAEIDLANNNTPLDQYLLRHPEQRSWPEARLLSLWGSEGKRTVLAHVPTYAFLHARACLMVLFNPGITDALQSFDAWPRRGTTLFFKMDRGLGSAVLWIFHRAPAAVVLLPVMAIVTLLYYGLALAGLRFIPAEPRFLICALVVYFVLISGIPVTAARYRLPFMPLLCVSAGLAVARRYQDKSRAKSNYEDVNTISALPVS